MIDYNFTETSFGLNLYCLSLYLFVIIFTTGRVVRYHKIQRKDNLEYLLLLGGFMLFLISSFINADFFSYQGYVRGFSKQEMGYMGVLDYLILYVIGRNFIIFRMFVWWGALFLVLHTNKRFKGDNFLVAYSLFAMFLLEFSYARATLAMAVYFYGLSFLCIPLKRWEKLSTLLGLSIILFSYTFHRSMAFLIVATPFVFITINKKNLIILLLLFPVAVGWLSELFFSTIDNQTISDELIMGKLEGYSDRDWTEELNLKGLFLTWINYITIYAMVIVGAILAVGKKGKNLPTSYIRFIKISIIIVLIASLFLFIDIPNDIFYYRILIMAVIPITLFFCYLYSKRLISNTIFLGLLFIRVGYHLVRLSYYVTSYW